LIFPVLDAFNDDGLAVSANLTDSAPIEAVRYRHKLLP
jgi:hypothetical protein